MYNVFVWSADISGRYSVKSAYAWLMRPEPAGLPPYEWSWCMRLLIPEKIEVLLVVKMNVDGSLGQHQAGFGGLIGDDSGRWLVSFFGAVREFSVLFAELMTLILTNHYAALITEGQVLLCRQLDVTLEHILRYCLLYYLLRLSIM